MSYVINLLATFHIIVININIIITIFIAIIIITLVLLFIVLSIPYYHYYSYYYYASTTIRYNDRCPYVRSVKIETRAISILVL